MKQFATGVNVVTVETLEGIKGMTLNAFVSISLEPKLIAISIGNHTKMRGHLDKVSVFGLNILSSEQEGLSQVFAGQSGGRNVKFDYLGFTPVLNGSLASMSCTIKDKILVGDHVVYIGEVKESILNEGNPLIYYKGKYNSISNSEVSK